MSIQVLDIYSGNAFNAEKEKATGTDAVIIKAGQGHAVYPYKAQVEQCKAVGLPYGLYWLCDARYSPEGHKAAIKTAFPTGDFGPLGLWLDVEKPLIAMPDWIYGKLPYAYYKPVESVWRGVYLYTGRYPGWYTSPGAWNVICWAMPVSLQDEIAEKADLWTAQYNNKIISPDLYGGWKRLNKWNLWQYQEGPDYSVWNGDEQSFREHFRLSIPEPEPVPMDSWIDGYNTALRDMRIKIEELVQ